MDITAAALQDAFLTVPLFPLMRWATAAMGLRYTTVLIAGCSLTTPYATIYTTRRLTIHLHRAFEDCCCFAVLR